MTNTRRIFEEPYLDSDGYVIIFNNEKLGIPQRKKLSFQLPRQLEERRALSSQELEKIDYTAGVPDKTYYIHPSDKNELIPLAWHVSSEAIYEMGLLDAMIGLREQLFAPGFLDKLRQCMQYGAHFTASKKRSRTNNNQNDPKQDDIHFAIGISAGQHAGVGAISLGNVSRAQQKDIDDWKLDLFKVATGILENCFPDEHSEARRKLWLKGSFTPVPPDQTDSANPTGSYRLTSAWLNVSDPIKEAENQSGNKPFANSKDDETEFTVLLCLSNLPENYFGGRLSLTSQRVSFSLRPLEALIYATRFYQFTCGVGPYSAERDAQVPLSSSSPLRPPRDPRVPDLPLSAPKLRVRVPMYSTKPLLESKFMCFHEEIWTDVMHGTMAPIDHREFMMRVYIENEILIRSRSMSMENQGGNIEGTGPRRMTLATATFQPQIKYIPSPYKYKDPLNTSDSAGSPTKRMRPQQGSDQQGEGSFVHTGYNLDAPYYPEVRDFPNEETNFHSPLYQPNHFQPEELHSAVKSPEKSPKKSYKKKNEVPDDVREALKIPLGNGLNLSDDHLRSLLKLTAPSRHKRASMVFNVKGRTFAKFKYLDEEKVAAKTSEKQKSMDFYQTIGEDLIRNGDPNHYVKLFQWTNPTTGEVLYPSVELAAGALGGYGEPNFEMAELKQTLLSLLCGTKQSKKRKAGDVDGAEDEDKGTGIEWTHSDLKHVFDPETETVPDNPYWYGVKDEPMDEW